jgi:lipopolysaccharide export system permease protein
MILRRYVVNEFLRSFAMIIGALVIIYFSTRFATYLGQAAEGKIAPAHISKMLLLRMLVSLKDLIPMSLYLGVFAAVIRLQRDLEMTAMRAAGAGHRLMLVSAAYISLVAALLVATITLYAEPRAEEVFQELKDQTQSEATIAGVKAGRFKEMSGGKRIFYAETVGTDEKTLKNAFVQARDGTEVGLMHSNDAFIETDKKNGDRFAVFLNGISYAGAPGALDYVVTHFSKYALRIEERLPTDLSNQVNYMPTPALFMFDAPGFKAELQWRIATPVATFLLPLLAVLFGMTASGSSWYINLITAVAGYFVYNNTLGVAKALVRKGALPPAIGLWIVHVILVLLIAGFLWYQRHPRQRRPKLKHALPT